MTTSDLTSVHDAMTRAIDAQKPLALVTYSLKVEQADKDQCETLCARHGTTLPEFLRQCMAGLISDYKTETPQA